MARTNVYRPFYALQQSNGGAISASKKSDGTWWAAITIDGKTYSSKAMSFSECLGRMMDDMEKGAE